MLMAKQGVMPSNAIVQRVTSRGTGTSKRATAKQANKAYQIPVLKMEDKIGGNAITWREIIEFPDCVETCNLIEMTHNGNRCWMIQVVNKLKRLKRDLKDLNKHSFSNVIAEVGADIIELDQFQRDLQINPEDQGLQWLEREKYQKFRRTSYMTCRTEGQAENMVSHLSIKKKGVQ
ncbi:hypothetical protein HAX54_016494 [Datura stramonium]|uniref:Uncharacterized protein n=1 Tax=Datura stramonium TaxID=4076 RepID=A0ABS8UJP8_DATST|nr:hypothetical protein [Datura stramonium]